MAVVEKKPEVQTASPFDRLAVASLAGVVYTLGSLIVAFWAVPAVCRLAGLDNLAFGPLLTGVLALAAIVVLAVFGYRLMGGAHSRPGLRAGIFLGFVFLALWALFSRWVGGIVEGSTYDGWLQSAPPGVGIGIAVALSGLFAYWLLRVFMRSTFEQRMIRFEEAGWFSFKTFKPGQGTRVRRGTILGILLLAGSGIWVLMNHRVLERGSSNWELNIPFSSVEIIDDVGDALVAHRDNKPILEEGKAATFRIISPGASTALVQNATVSRDKVVEAVTPLLKEKRAKLDDLLERLQARQKQLKKDEEKQTDSTVKMTLKNEGIQLSKWIESLKEYRAALTEKNGKPQDSVFLFQKELDRFVTVEQERERERRRADQAAATRGSLKEEMQWIADWARQEPLPVAAYVFTRYDVRDINEQLDPLRFRVISSTAAVDSDGHVELFAELSDKYQFRPNQVVSNSDFQAAVEELKKKNAGASSTVIDDITKKAYAVAPEAKPMKGSPVYASIMLMPSVRYTVPLLLMVLAIWVAWRIVNLPTFGDFLIATEAEMNKVSWTTRQHLMRDTVVVLVTMVLMAVFLFVVDIAWAKLLSSKPIGVLRVSEHKEKPKKESDLKW